MRATGIVRRVDELGRIVIPKEFLRSLNIHDGDAMEIYPDQENGLVMKPYRPEGLTFEQIQNRWQSLSVSERQELLCTLVNHIDDAVEEY